MFAIGLSGWTCISLLAPSVLCCMPMVLTEIPKIESGCKLHLLRFQIRGKYMQTSALCVSQTTLPRSGVTISRVGMGLAHTHMLTSANRQHLIRRALELGISHFDTARLYADGMSKRGLGEGIAGIRNKVTITTKFGMLPTPFI